MKVNTLVDSPAYVREYSVGRCEVRVSGVLEEFAQLQIGRCYDQIQEGFAQQVRRN